MSISILFKMQKPIPSGMGFCLNKVVITSTHIYIFSEMKGQEL